MSFDAMGRPNRDFYVFVEGTRSTAANVQDTYPNAPVGYVLVTRANGIHAFYKPNPTAPWQRL